MEDQCLQTGQFDTHLVSASSGDIGKRFIVCYSSDHSHQKHPWLLGIERSGATCTGCQRRTGICVMPYAPAWAGGGRQKALAQSSSARAAGCCCCSHWRLTTLAPALWLLLGRRATSYSHSLQHIPALEPRQGLARAAQQAKCAEPQRMQPGVVLHALGAVVRHSMQVLAQQAPC